MATEEKEQLLTLQQFATFAGIGVSTARRKALDGEIKSVKKTLGFRTTTMVPKSELKKFNK